jgi:hypothetical protein
LLPGLLLLGACASEPPPDDGSGRTVQMPQQWDAIDLADADLTLPLVAPLEIATLGKRIGEGQVFENLYTFHGVKGYVLTSRVAFGGYTTRYSGLLRSPEAFRDFTAELKLPPGGAVTVGEARAFLNGEPATRGFVAEAAVPPYHDRCFVARVGYLMVDYASVTREPDAVDTVVEAFLCGDLPRHAKLLEMMTRVKAVEDRAAFRRALAKSAIGTI